ncbi:MAG: 1-acyl-sn-glycerol-3-phosphate acyltransferase [Treponema sp.]|jgi:1-acyl-sn-glycerol-3-phosphate acyltransferase|nr:1-acyl-sn-glycerol-3-phosphate acyltransferase [Treponema sp.]
MSLIKTIAVFTVLVFAMITLIPIGLVIFILSVVGMKRLMSLLIYKIAQGWALLIIKCSGCTLTVSGRENIPQKGGVCFVSNHVGIFDIILALGLIGRPFGFIAKKELAFIPFLNIWIWLLGGLFIDRIKIRKAVKTINSGVQRLKAGGCMLIFPEGTRSKGSGLNPFKPGSLKLATQAGAPIIPVAIAGSYDAFEKNYRVQSVPVQVTFGKPIDTAGLSAEYRKQIGERIHDEIAGALGLPKNAEENSPQPEMEKTRG